MLTPADLRRLPNPLLRARFTAHLLDENGPNRREFEEIFRSAVEELMAAGFGLTEIATGTFMDEPELRRRVLSSVDGFVDALTPARSAETRAVSFAGSAEAIGDDDLGYSTAIRAWQASDASLRRRLAELDDSEPYGEDVRRHLLDLERLEDDCWLQVLELGRRLGVHLPLRTRPVLPF